MKRPLIALAAITTMAAAAPAFAEEIQVNHHDLNLTTIEGQQTLDRRVDRAAKRVCGYNELRSGSRFVTPSMRSCLAKAKAGANSQVAAIVDDKRLGG
ncbi:UrcA family protein [Altererythrobacter luteolus]|uniref:UrcA family protein n=1 Tax=Pontixanthobacter luteolus TaxID=295089 RepID=A0A6I4V4S3_9SPHN|nr:UrcA family protein [Pontixanthobacter luteolus]MXP47860.1 UrcA family protein [Pontixanthobacter luteolus]